MRSRARWPVPRRPAAGVSSLIELDGAQLSSILEANHKVLVRQNMLEKGTTKEQAEAQVGLIALVPKYLGRAKLSLTCEDSRPATERLTLEVKRECPRAGSWAEAQG